MDVYYRHDYENINAVPYHFSSLSPFISLKTGYISATPSNWQQLQIKFICGKMCLCMCINLLFVITSNVAVSVAVAHVTFTELVIAVNLTSTKSCDRSIKSGSGKTSSKLIRNLSTKKDSFSLLGANITGSKSSTMISIDEAAEALHKTICSCPQHPCLLFSITTIANEQELFQIYISFL